MRDIQIDGWMLYEYPAYVFPIELCFMKANQWYQGTYQRHDYSVTRSTFMYLANRKKLTIQKSMNY